MSASLPPWVSDKGEEEAVLTFGELHRRAAVVATRLRQTSSADDRALLMFGPGLDFIIAYFGCILADVIPVPMMLPRRNSSLDSSASITANCAPRFLITNAHVHSARPDVIERFSGAEMQWITLDQARPPWKRVLRKHWQRGRQLIVAKADELTRSAELALFINAKVDVSNIQAE